MDCHHFRYHRAGSGYLGRINDQNRQSIGRWVSATYQPLTTTLSAGRIARERRPSGFIRPQADRRACMGQTDKQLNGNPRWDDAGEPPGRSHIPLAAGRDMDKMRTPFLEQRNIFCTPFWGRGSLNGTSLDTQSGRGLLRTGEPVSQVGGPFTPNPESSGFQPYYLQQPAMARSLHFRS